MSRERWLAELADTGERRVTDVFGYDRLARSWSVNFADGLPEHLIYLLVGGNAAGMIAGRAVVLRAGTLLWLPPRTPFHLHATGNASLQLYRFRLASETAVGGPYVVADAWALRDTFDALVAELGGRLELRAVRIRALLVVLFSGIFRLTGRAAGPAPLSDPVRARLEKIVDGDPAARPSIAELAAAAGLSADYFARRFGETFGMSPRAWLVRRRIHRAMLWLDESEESVSAIARRLGYPDVFLFSRQFKAVTGVSPRAWRERGRR
jgi:AraC-like DNA-binding protein